ncbi:hypothetical protein BDZ89DRAFT_1152030 [Hymenopellis radicata]|nr:hypothetical protein BDZ89DRAFT_1152030 [Hymenopellis radicata]
MSTSPVLHRRARLRLVPSSRAVLPNLPHIFSPRCTTVVSLPCCITTGWASIVCIVHVATPCAIARESAAGTKRSPEPNPRLFWQVTRTRTAGPGWLRNASIKDNIPFNLSFNAQRYTQTLEVCALVADLAILEDDDESEIRERGSYSHLTRHSFIPIAHSNAGSSSRRQPNPYCNGILYIDVTGSQHFDINLKKALEDFDCTPTLIEFEDGSLQHSQTYDHDGSGYRVTRTIQKATPHSLYSAGAPPRPLKSKSMLCWPRW